MILPTVPTAPSRLLSYCTNVHPGESAEEIFRALTLGPTRVRDQISPGRPFALGLRLPAEAVHRLRQDPDLDQRFRGFFLAQQFLPRSLNIFPQGAFHAPVVKESVYEPPWGTVSRTAYTLAAAKLLASWLPDDDPYGTLSTVPVGSRGLTGVARDSAASALVTLAGDLARLEQDTGRHLVLALEPEPSCVLETSDDVVQWFRNHLLPEAERALGPPGPDVVLRHLGVCLDACHAAVMFEPPVEAYRRIRQAGISIPKVQISSALRWRPEGDDGRVPSPLARFVEQRFLHQVVARCRTTGQLISFQDLPAFLSWRRDRGGPIDEARCHFHVPVHLRVQGSLGTTQEDLTGLLDLLREDPHVRHLEVETYTLSVLPTSESPATDPIGTIVAEMDWALQAMGGRPGPEP